MSDILVKYKTYHSTHNLTKLRNKHANDKSLSSEVTKAFSTQIICHITTSISLLLRFVLSISILPLFTLCIFNSFDNCYSLANAFQLGVLSTLASGVANS